MYSDLWVEERFKDFYGMRYKVEKVLYSKKSDFQTVDVVETKGHGKMLLNDGLVMVTELDEFIYHDMITHVPLFIHPNPKNVLIIGGGDGGTAREVLRHRSVERCTMVEIDQAVIDACIQHIPQTSCKLNDKKLKLVVDDGVKFVKETKEKFDVILVDSTDPIGPAQPLFGDDFYKDIYACLSDNGIVVSQGESPFYAKEMQKKLMSILHKFFPLTSIYTFTNMSYPGGLWAFTFASKGLHPIKDFNPQRVVDSKLKFQYYNEQIHSGAFAIPTFMRENIREFIKGV